MRYTIHARALNLKKRKLPERIEYADSHVEATCALMQAVKERRLAVVLVDGQQVGTTVRICNAEWSLRLLSPLEIKRNLA